MLFGFPSYFLTPSVSVDNGAPCSTIDGFYVSGKEHIRKPIPNPKNYGFSRFNPHVLNGQHVATVPGRNVPRVPRVTPAVVSVSAERRGPDGADVGRAAFTNPLCQIPRTGVDVLRRVDEKRRRGDVATAWAAWAWGWACLHVCSV